MNKKYPQGIVRIGLGHPWYLGYGARHGAFKWLPFHAQWLIVTVWNRILCACRGHVPVDVEDFPNECIHCGHK